MYQDALHHKKTVLNGSQRLLFVASEHLFYLTLHSFQQRGVFGPTEPENPQNKHGTGLPGVRGERRGGKQFAIFLGTCDVTISRTN